MKISRGKQFKYSWYSYLQLIDIMDFLFLFFSGILVAKAVLFVGKEDVVENECDGKGMGERTVTFNSTVQVPFSRRNVVALVLQVAFICSGGMHTTKHFGLVWE